MKVISFSLAVVLVLQGIVYSQDLRPIWVTFSADSSRAYVSNQVNGAISVIDTVAGSVIDTIGGFSCRAASGRHRTSDIAREVGSDIRHARESWLKRGMDS